LAKRGSHQQYSIRPDPKKTNRADLPLTSPAGYTHRQEVEILHAPIGRQPSQRFPISCPTPPG
jgi:hypothetical protein